MAVAVVGQRRHGLLIGRGQAASEVDPGADVTLGRQLRVGPRHLRERLVPRLRVTLLRADVEGHADPAAGAGSLAHQADRLVGRAAELARKRPVRAHAGRHDPHVDRAAGSLAEHLVELGFAVDGEDADAAVVRVADVGLFLDRVAVRQPAGRDPARQAQGDLARARDVERGAVSGEYPEHLRRRIRLDRVEHGGGREGGGQPAVLMSDEVEVEHQERRRQLRVCGEEIARSGCRH